MNDLTLALRQLRKSPGFTFVAVLTLALGIGANTAVFSVVNAVLLRPLPYPDADRVMLLSEVRAARGPSRGPVSAPDFSDWRRIARSFSSIALHGTARFSINAPGDPESVTGARVTAGFFEALGVSPHMGRWFSMSEEQPGYEPVAILSYGLW